MRDRDEIVRVAQDLRDQLTAFTDTDTGRTDG